MSHILLDDPAFGMSTWQEQVHKKLREINEWAVEMQIVPPSPERAAKLQAVVNDTVRHWQHRHGGADWYRRLLELVS